MSVLLEVVLFEDILVRVPSNQSFQVDADRYKIVTDLEFHWYQSKLHQTYFKLIFQNSISI